MLRTAPFSSESADPWLRGRDLITTRVQPLTANPLHNSNNPTTSVTHHHATVATTMQHPTADGGATQASLAKPAPRKYKVNCWLRFCDTIERRTEAFLGEVAAFAARRSCMVIALCMSFVLLCGGGFAFFTVLWRTTLHPTCPAGL